VIDADTPGGEVPGTFELSRLIRTGREHKEIITVGHGFMASAGYWIGSAASKVYAIPSAYALGSIGVLYIHEYSKGKDRQVTVLRSVDRKTLINPYEKLNSTAVEDLEYKIAKTHETFVANVALNRGISVDVVNNDFGQGGTFLADDAKDVGLIDDIATLDEVLSEPVRKPSTVSVTSAGIPTGRKPFAKGKHVKLSAQLKAALVLAGFCAASASDGDFVAALELHCEAAGISINKDDLSAQEAELLASLKALRADGGNSSPSTQAASGGQQTTQAEGNPSANTAAQQLIADLLPQAQSIVSISAIPEADRFRVMTELQAAIQSGKVTSYAGIVQRVQDAQSANSPAAGSAMPTVDQDAVDKILDGAVVGILQSGRTEVPESFVRRDGSRCRTQDVPMSYELRKPSRIIEAIVRATHGPQAVASRDRNLLIMDFFANNLGAATSHSAYNTTGMFQDVLYNATRVQAFREYQAVDPEYRRWCPQGFDLRDFGVHEFKHVGMLTSPKVIGEDGEFTEATYLGTESEQVRLGLWGYRYGYTWQMALADDLGFFQGTQAKMLAGIGVKEDNIVHQYLASNPKMKDGYRLFSSEHNNLLEYTGTNCFTEKIVRQTKSTLYHQKDVGHNDARDGDNESLQLPFRQIVMPLNLEEQANKYFESEAPAGETNSGVANVHRNLISRENRIGVGLLDEEAGGDPYTWYGQTDRNRAEWMSWHNLEGFDQPRILTANSESGLTMHILCFKPFGVSAKDFRGAIKVACNVGGGQSPT
jgi:ClpP class serine protease